VVLVLDDLVLIEGSEEGRAMDEGRPGRRGLRVEGWRGEFDDDDAAAEEEEAKMDVLERREI